GPGSSVLSGQPVPLSELAAKSTGTRRNRGHLPGIRLGKGHNRLAVNEAMVGPMEGRGLLQSACGFQQNITGRNSAGVAYAHPVVPLNSANTQGKGCRLLTIRTGQQWRLA